MGQTKSRIDQVRFGKRRLTRAALVSASTTPHLAPQHPDERLPQLERGRRLDDDRLRATAPAAAVVISDVAATDFPLTGLNSKATKFEIQ
jgi:hypothetical protein